MKLIFCICFCFLFLELDNYSGREFNYVEIGKKKAFLVSVEDTVVPGFDPNDTQNGDRYRDNIEDLLLDNDFKRQNIKKLTNPTDTFFISELENSIKELENEDFLVVYFYGHGGQIPDENGDEKKDKKDETLVMKNDIVIDDSIYNILLKYKSTARILFIIEACNSETSIKMLNIDGVDILTHNNVLDKNIRPSFDIIYLGATLDGTSVPSNLFNKKLIETIENEEYNNYSSFFEALAKNMFKKDVMISVDFSWASKDFINQPPFN